jgi:hypothetical protein
MPEEPWIRSESKAGCAASRSGGLNTDGTWDFAVSVQNDDGDTHMDDQGDFEHEGTALWFDSADFGDSFQGTIEDGLVKMDYDFCADGNSDIQLVFQR